MADTSNLSKFLSDVADAIRTKKDVIDPIPAADFDTEILSIDVGTDTSDATAVEENIEKGKTAYVNGEKLTGTLEDAGGSEDVMVAPTNITIGNERGWDCVSTTYTNSGKKIHKDGWYVNQHIKFEDLAPKLGVTPEVIVSGNTILGVEGTGEGGGSGAGTEDATATPDDVFSPKTFYAGGKKQKGAVEVTTKVISDGMTCEMDETVNSYWVADICDKYGIAVVYVYNQQNPWWIYKWEGNHLGSVLMSLSAGAYPNGTLTKSVSISKEKNNQGYLNIWSHAVNENKWSDDMNGFFGVLQYDVENNEIITSARVTTSKQGGYNSTWNEDGNMAACSADPEKCFVTYHNQTTLYMQLLTYNAVSNVITRTSTTLSVGTTAGPSYSSEWSNDGKYVLVSRGAKSHPEQYFIIKVNENNSLTRLYYASNTRPNSIYKNYIILGNNVYDFSTGSLSLKTTWTYIRNFAQGEGIIWTYNNFLFVSDYTKATFYGYKINDDLTLTGLFQRPASTYVASSYNQYMGTTVMPMSNSFLYFSPTKSLMYKVIPKNATSKVSSLIVQGELFANIGETTATQADVLLGKVFFDKDGETTGTMSDNGYLSYDASTSTQSIPKGYTSGGTISAVTAEIDENITADNIKQGVTILGVEGTYAPTGGDATSDAEIQAKYLLESYSAVSDGKWVEGTMVNRGIIDMIWNGEVQEIPTGYYDELYIPKAIASSLDGYEECSDALDIVMYGKNYKYTELNYIESTGNQFIDIDYIPKTLHTKYEIGFMRLSVNGIWNPIINNEEDVRFGIMCTKDANTNTNDGQFHIGASNNMQSITFPMETNVKYDIIADKTGISLNGTKYEVEDEVVDATGTWSACINHRYMSATTFSPEYSIGRWYYLKIYEDNILVKHLVPAMETTTNKICMYDIINRNFYYNIGEGNFISGGVKE